MADKTDKKDTAENSTEVSLKISSDFQGPMSSMEVQ